ncbi:MAG: hypothetical protein Q7J59_06800, partial [Elusimicrobiota bacterium]|nr:hypothetical protein [Elusimicrobiota bacterium]
MKKISFKNMSISGKMFFIHFILIVPLFVALGSWQIRVIKKELTEISIERFLKDARVAMDFMDYTMYNTVTSVQSFAESPVFKMNYSPSEMTLR